ncbi:MAG TPA: DNA cytosine methyltransferase [Oculatellaceae cyanobacterium]
MGSPRQRTLKYLGVAPSLPLDAPDAIVLFAGGGGVECGLIEAGIRPILSVELDPSQPDLSAALAATNHLNFKPYGGRVIRRTVQALATAKFADFPHQPDYLIATPVCTNFSQANNGEEQDGDIEAALAVAQGVSILQPACFILENVPTYRKSKSWQLIETTLNTQGYFIVSSVLDVADYGVPQSRRRFIVKATKVGSPGFPLKQHRIGWYQAIADLIPHLPPSDLLNAQQVVLEERLSFKPGLEALIIERIGYKKKPQAKEPAEPIWTLKKSIFHDQRGNNRSKFIDIWLASGHVKALTIEGAARLQGFPTWYCLPKEVRVAGSILGYSVPPPLVKALVS